MDERIEALARIAVDTGFHIHTGLGPGLLESVCETVLENRLRAKGIRVARQVAVDFTFDGIIFEGGLVADLILDDILLIELKSVEKLSGVHAKQVVTYLRLMNLPLGLLMNFGAGTFKEGIQRIANSKPSSFAS
jgi:GxxExxY protein